MMKCENQPALTCPIGNIGVSARPMVVFSGFLYESNKPPSLGNARGIVLTHRDGQQNGQQSGYILHYCCVDCRPGSHRGDMERVVTRWRRSVASGEALVILHRAMRSVLHRHTAMAI